MSWKKKTEGFRDDSFPFNDISLLILILVKLSSIDDCQSFIYTSLGQIN